MDTSMDIPKGFEVMQNNSGDNGNSGREMFFKEKFHQFGNYDEDLFLSLKCHIDSQQRLIQLYRTRIRSFEIFRKYCQRLVHFGGGETIEFNLEQFQNEYNKFDRNYHYFRKRIRNLRKQTKSKLSLRNQNVYDILYGLAAKLESNDDFETRYLSGDQLYPEVTINEVIESTESPNDSTTSNRGSTQGNSIQCDLNNFSSVCTSARVIQSQYSNLDTIQIYPEISLNNVEDQQPELTNNDTFENGSLQNDIENTLDNSDDYDNEDYFVEPHKQNEKPRKKASKVQSLRETESIKSKSVLKKIKQETFTDSSTDSNSSPQKKNKKTAAKIPTTPKVFSCDVEGCQYSSPYLWNLNMHKSKHSDARPFKCDKCDAAFKTKCYLKVHQNTHDGQRFGCTYEGCTANYATKCDISKHIKRFHTKKAPLLHCDWEGCDYTTCRNECLKVHRKVHTDERPFKCPDCEMSFKSKATLWSHKLIHQTERRFKCDFEGCDYASNNKAFLLKHQYVHNVDRPFNCDWPECGMSFKSPYGIWSHKLMHENQRRYRCKWEGCEYAANLSGTLHDHVKAVHQNKKKRKSINKSINCLAPALPRN